jgi:hypothetical protein
MRRRTSSDVAVARKIDRARVLRIAGDDFFTDGNVLAIAGALSKSLIP